MEAKDEDLGLVSVGVNECDWKWRYICAKLRRNSLAQFKHA